MPTFRDDVRQITPYAPGRPLSEVAREHGFRPEDLVKLASNESPVPPFPEVTAAIAAAAEGSNRYPDNDCHDLRHALAAELGCEPESVWIGAGSSELLRVAALATGGTGTSAVYAWPSFVIYRLSSILAMSDRREVPVTTQLGLDPEALVGAVGEATTILYLCNPNNPTGTHLGADAVRWVIEQVPERVLIVVDEAYLEYVDAPDYASALPLALERPNVLVARTFSKIYGLATLRVGYAVTAPETVTELRKAQAPFTVSTLAQVAALESLRHPQRRRQRCQDNAAGRRELEAGLGRLGVDYVPSQANFVFFRLPSGTDETTAAFLRHGVIIRPFADGWVRVSVGTPAENRRFAEALERELPALS